MTVAAKLSPAAAAERFSELSREGGWSFAIRGSVVMIEKRFSPGDKDAFVDADMDAYGILDAAPLKGGSVWGTDGGSIGGMDALKSGVYRLNKSGSGSRFLAALAKIHARSVVSVR